MQQVTSPRRLFTGRLGAPLDWPGVFIRGEEALALASNIENAQRADFLPVEGPGAIMLAQIVDLLRACKVSNG